MGYSEDEITQSRTSLDYPHHEIHEGNHFAYNDSVTIASGGSQAYLLTTGNKSTHISFEFDGSAVTTIDIYEGSTHTGTTLQTIFNNKRSSEKVSANTIHKGATGGSDGTKFWGHSSGSSTGATVRGGASSTQNSEYILKKNTKYLIRISSGTDSNRTNMKLNWYEK